MSRGTLTHENENSNGSLVVHGHRCRVTNCLKKFPRNFGTYLEYFAVFHNCYLFIPRLTAEPRTVFCRTLLGKVLFREITDVCSEIHTEHINTLWAEGYISVYQTCWYV
jgi:hypothetical protein